MQHQTTPHSRKLRWLFAVISLGLIAQWCFALVIQEPYPAIVYPAFTALAVTDGQVQLDKAEIVIRSKMQAPVRVDAQRFFQSLPKAFVESALATIAQRAKQTERTAQMRIGPYQFEIKGALSQDTQMITAFKQWLRQEIRHNLQIAEPTQLTISTYQYQLDLAGRMIDKAHLRNSLTIDLRIGEKQ